ncbi:AAA family ATPase [Aeromonas hydrophila]|uniref:AAA family ATPase n=1 Tax=Aeromonas hydrophila TaxID=644 RepID=UPI00207CE5CA|nr:AAA family ATPase [Aeromonas hydrophila]MCO4206866.1 AAA family ATPase [Aeromonas hydrophila]
MALDKIVINNFRSISLLELSLTPANKVICFVGENGSSKTAVLTSIIEAFIAKTKHEYPGFRKEKNLRYRILSPKEIQAGENFYSIEVSYSKIKGEQHTFKKLVAENKDIPPSIYEHAISELTLTGNYYAESSTLDRMNAEADFLNDNVFLFRPGHRYEQDALIVDKDEIEWDSKLSIAKSFDGKMPYPHTVAYSGNDYQTMILDMFFDAQVGYKDSLFGFQIIPKILNEITNKDFGVIQISQSPYRQLFSSKLGALSGLSQGELDLLVTISNIIKQQMFFFQRYSHEEKNQYGISDVLKVPGIVLIDEVDLHLHPKAQENYIRVLTEMFPNIQFIVTTHSPFVIRGLPENAVVVQLPSGRKFDNNFGAMDIDSITNIIFGYDGGFSEETQKLIGKFKSILTSEEPDQNELKRIYKLLRSSASAREELDLFLASFASIEIINIVQGA